MGKGSQGDRHRSSSSGRVFALGYRLASISAGIYCNLLAGVARGVRSLLIEEDRVLGAGKMGVVSSYSTRR
jgi:hypothetical protein